MLIILAFNEKKKQIKIGQTVTKLLFRNETGPTVATTDVYVQGNSEIKIQKEGFTSRNPVLCETKIMDYIPAESIVLN